MIVSGERATFEDAEEVLRLVGPPGGVPMTSVMGGLMGRSCGLMAGKGGSMHLTIFQHGMTGSYAIIGADLTIANGAALSAEYRKSGQVTVCVFGDGATNVGALR